MLPFDNKPWAKPLARSVIVLAFLGAAAFAWFLHSIGQLYIPEVTGIVLLLLTIVPPNVAVLRKKTKVEGEAETESEMSELHHGTLHIR